jgi:hypothetical protein
MLRGTWPTAGSTPGPQPVSISSSFEPVLITCGLYGTTTMSFGKYAASAAAMT